MTRLRVFIAGPYSNGDIYSADMRRQNVKVALATASQLAGMGFAPVCPHLLHFIDREYPLADNERLEICQSWLDSSDVVLRIHGESKRSDMLCARAVEKRIKIYKSVRELREDLCEPPGDKK